MNTPILLTDRITRTRYKRVYKMAQGGCIHGIVSMAVSRFHLRRDESAIPQTSAECLRMWLCDRRGPLRSIVEPQPITHWSETTWASWGLALLILASLVVFGVLGCQKRKPADLSAIHYDPCDMTTNNLCVMYTDGHGHLKVRVYDPAGKLIHEWTNAN